MSGNAREPQPPRVDVNHSDNVIVGPHGQQIIHNWRSTTDRQPRHPRPAVLIAAAVFAVIGLLVTYAVIVNTRDSGTSQSGPELAASARIPDRDGNGFRIVVPGRYRPQAKFLTMASAATDDELAGDLYRVGGVRLAPIDLEVVLTGQQDREIRILDIGVKIIRRGEPLGGAAFLLNGQGQAPVIPMAVDFDEPNPVPREATEIVAVNSSSALPTSIDRRSRSPTTNAKCWLYHCAPPAPPSNSR